MTDESGPCFDVRQEIAQQQDPFVKIMHSAGELKPGQTLVIINTFQPRLLYKALTSKGFTYEAEPYPGGGWRITVTNPVRLIPRSKTVARTV